MDRNREPIFVGIDWGGSSHYVVAQRGCVVLHRGFVAHSGEALHAFSERLRAWCDGDFGAVQVATELEGGALVDHFVALGARVFAMSPKRSAALRATLQESNAKDDARDARVLVHALAFLPDALKPVRARGPSQRELRAACAAREALLEARHAHVVRVQDRLRGYFPELLTSCREAIGRRWFSAIFRLIPTPAAAAKVRPSQFKAALRKAGCRRDADGLLAALRKTPLVLAPGATEAAVRDVEGALRALEFLRTEERIVDRRIADAVAAWRREDSALQKQRERDEAVLRSLPGVGDAVFAALIAEAAELIQRRDYRALRLYAGVAAVTIRSGQSERVQMRRAACPRLRGALYHWARMAAILEPNCRERYRSLRAERKTHGRALRGIVDRLLELAFILLRRGETYDPNRRSATPPTAAAS